MFDSLTKGYLPETDFPVRKIDEEKCTRCGRCVETCPTFGFKWQKGEVPIPRGYGGFSQACLNCGNCTAVCPSDAITMSGSYSVREGRYKNSLQAQMAFPNPMCLKGEKDYDTFKEELTDVERAIYERRSNRLFKDKAVPREVIERVLEAGRFAPSAGNCQPYKFVVIQDQKLIHEFESLAMKTLRTFKNLYLDRDGKKPLWKSTLFTFLSYFMINKLDPRPFTAIEKADNRNNRIYFDAPCIILILKDKRGVSNPDLDAGICAQNMVLSAHSLGLGTCYIGLSIEPLNYPLMAGFRKKLGIRHPFEAVTSIAMGYPKGKIDGVVKRDTPQVSWIGF
ncbi:MAG: nitroreductase family protein [Proteobacteria bacterium]|nr:nitroreductase family protein [Pseudomonadota bacterium]